MLLLKVKIKKEDEEEFLRKLDLMGISYSRQRIKDPQVSIAGAKHLIELIHEQIKDLYPDDFIQREATKAWAWLEVNSHKKPKSSRGYKRFFFAWLDRGWEKHRVTLKSNDRELVDWEKVKLR